MIHLNAISNASTENYLIGIFLLLLSFQRCSTTCIISSVALLRFDGDCAFVALQAHPFTPSNNQNDAIKGKKEVTVGGMKEAPNPAPVKIPSPKLARAVKKAMPSYSHFSPKSNSKRRVVDAISWDSLTSNIIKSGKVFEDNYSLFV